MKLIKTIKNRFGFANADPGREIILNIYLHLAKP